MPTLPKIGVGIAGQEGHLISHLDRGGEKHYVLHITPNGSRKKY